MPTPDSAPWLISQYSQARIGHSSTQISARQDFRSPLFHRAKCKRQLVPHHSLLTHSHIRTPPDSILRANCLVSLGTKRRSFVIAPFPVVMFRYSRKFRALYIQRDGPFVSWFLRPIQSGNAKNLRTLTFPTIPLTRNRESIHVIYDHTSTLETYVRYRVRQSQYGQNKGSDRSPD